MLKSITNDLTAASVPADEPRPKAKVLRLEGRWVTALALAGAFLWGQVWLQREHLFNGPPNEFLMAFGAARVVGAVDIYDPAGLAFERSPLTAVLTAPLTVLPFPNAYWIWSLLGVWSVVGFVLLWKPSSRITTMIAACVSAPLFLAFLDGRALPVVLLALAAGAAAARGGRDFHAGLWLSLCWLEFPLFAPLPLVVAAQRRWATLRGFLVGTFGLLGLAVWACGVDWPRRLSEVWAAYPETASSPTLLAGLTAAGLGAEWLFPVGFALAAAIWVIAARLDWTSALGVGLAAGLLISPRAEIADAVVLLPAALALYGSARTRALRWTAFALLTPLPYLAGPYAGALTVVCALALTAAAGWEATGARWETETPLVRRIERHA